MIPKILHYCWFGPQKIPDLVEKCISTWSLYHSDYQIIKWDENNSPVTSNPFVIKAYQTANWAFVSDFVRFYALAGFGGIYLDTDMFLLKPLDPLLDNHCFIGSEREDVVSTGIIGAIPNHWFIQKCLDLYRRIKFDEVRKYPTSPILCTNILRDFGFIPVKKRYNIRDIKIYPSQFFYPLPYKKKDKNIFDYSSKSSYTIHLWASSWHSEWDCFINREKTRAVEIVLNKISLKYLFSDKNFIKLIYYLFNINRVRNYIKDSIFPCILNKLNYPEFILKHLNYFSVKRFAPPQENFTPEPKKFRRLNVRYDLPINEHNGWRTYFLAYKEGTFQLLKNIKDDNIIIDVGANIGFYSLSMAKKAEKGKVYCFEPQNENYRTLLKHVHLNNLKNMCCHNMALGSKLKNFQLEHFGGNNNGTYRINEDQGVHSGSVVSMVTLDSFLDKRNLPKIDLIKIDTEGYEYEVIIGAMRAIKKYKPVIFLEINDAFLKHFNSSAKSIVQFISELGYKISNADTDEIISDESYLDYCQIDALCHPL